MHKMCTSEWKTVGAWPRQSLKRHYNTHAIHSVNAGNPGVFWWKKNESARSENHRWTPGEQPEPTGQPKESPVIPSIDEILRHSHQPNSPTFQSGNLSDRRELGGPRLYQENDRWSPPGAYLLLDDWIKLFNVLFRSGNTSVNHTCI